MENTDNLQSLLSERRSSILRRWQQGILETYPKDTAAFLAGQKDPFANPVGAAMRAGAEGILDAILSGGGRDALVPHLEAMVKIRAVQDFTPGQAVGFVFLLKLAVHEELDRGSAGGIQVEEVRRFEARVDELALLAFEVYMRCREKIYEIRAGEARRQTAVLLERASRVLEHRRAGKDKEQEGDGD